VSVKFSATWGLFSVNPGKVQAKKCIHHKDSW
jgi:hypothetical protein